MCRFSLAAMGECVWELFSVFSPNGYFTTEETQRFKVRRCSIVIEDLVTHEKRGGARRSHFRSSNTPPLHSFAFVASPAFVDVFGCFVALLVLVSHW